MKRPERREAELKRVKSRANQNKTRVFSELNPSLLSSAHADIKLALSCL